MINTKSSIGDIKPKHAIKPDIVNLKKSETYLKEKVLPEDGYIDIYISLVSNMEIKKRANDFIWSKNTYRLDRIVKCLGNHVLYYMQDVPDRAKEVEVINFYVFLCYGNHILVERCPLVF